MSQRRRLLVALELVLRKEFVKDIGVGKEFAPRGESVNDRGVF